MATATFDDWLRAVFGHSPRQPEWYWDDDFDERWNALGLSDALTVEYMNRLFLESGCLGNYTLEQIAQGIWFLIGESSPGQSAYTLLKVEVPVQQRIRCVGAINQFFRTFVATAAPGPSNEKNDPFHIACYMWWDIFPTYGDPYAGEEKLHDACLKAMAEILRTPSELCQLSALHGLNHWHEHHGDKVEIIVDSFLREPSAIAPRIVQYANAARAGSAL